ncbi:Mitogen-activated protein kinase-binding protein 1, partial [Ophiophagus hannah]
RASSLEKRGKAALILSSPLPLLVRSSSGAALVGAPQLPLAAGWLPVAPASPFGKPAKPSRAELAGEERRQGGRAGKARKLFEGDRGSRKDETRLHGRELGERACFPPPSSTERRCLLSQVTKVDRAPPFISPFPEEASFKARSCVSWFLRQKTGLTELLADFSILCYIRPPFVHSSPSRMGKLGFYANFCSAVSRCEIQPSRTSLWKAFERGLCFLPTKTMMSVEGSTITSRIKNLLRSPSIKLRRSKPGTKRENISTKASWATGPWLSNSQPVDRMRNALAMPMPGLAKGGESR